MWKRKQPKSLSGHENIRKNQNDTTGKWYEVVSTSVNYYRWLHIALEMAQSI